MAPTKSTPGVAMAHRRSLRSPAAYPTNAMAASITTTTEYVTAARSAPGSCHRFSTSLVICVGFPAGSPPNRTHSAAQRLVRALAKGFSIDHCEATGVCETPPRGGGRDGGRRSIGSHEFLADAAQSDEPQVRRGSGVEKLLEYVLHPSRRHEDRPSHVYDADVQRRVLLDVVR